MRVWLRQQRALYTLWKWLPDEQQGRLRFLYERWNVRRSAPGGPAMSEFTRARLRQHFSRDLALLDGLACDQPPWLAGYRTA